MSSRHFVFIAITLFVLAAAMPSRGQTQMQMTQQAEASFEAADAELNAIYDQVTKALPDEPARKKLIHAQKAWGIFRDAQAELDADQARGGSLQPQIYAMSEEATTRARIAQLKQLLKELQAQ
jgi:uncharacterized protein YecT (DUF1311 family)